MRAGLWHDYVWGRQNLEDLATKEGRSLEWVRQQLDQVVLKEKPLTPQATVFVTDTTFFGKKWGVCVFRTPHLKKNVWWTDVESEVMATYHYGRKILEERGWEFEAVVVDGRRGMIKVFEGIPIQICHFHQMRTVTKYLTRRPETEAGKDLRSIMLQLTTSTEAEYTKLLTRWKQKYHYVLNDKTHVLGTKRWYYTHKKTRSAFLSLERNLPYLFTYQKYPGLNIPNTTNSLDGSFTHLKDKVDIHHGLRKDRRYKMIKEILGGRED